ncbi:MAG: hypothetical protein GY727_09765 [Gammaproteobacteria bacterium]|nr:hypothetical protein [Gammaproteobacteria bacterium]MCP4090742.1 hypothetical protein [Gammaproteobacteria bacterium]MCP4277169.1 hypothetical protein [Gammaproteobacteria bacterium]MCP4831697.1 hypothetical protein [Gammaproteobacteria bacterium]MCP4928021.1 hypothetical protein [Gammaproteobacteria bacterium]
MGSYTETTNIESSTALWWGIAFSFAFTGLIWLAGAYWMDPDRFSAFSPRKTAALIPQMWYLWQLNEPTVWTRATAWGGYIAHNLFIWFLIWKAQGANTKYTKNLHRFNVLALLGNGFFITLHLLQTRFWYDGLAQDVSEFTSQASVTLMLVAILIMENNRRGLVFGAKAPFLSNVGRVIRKYHGYYFSWAIIYTFWYHPMEITGGHLLGFLYMFFLLLQGSLFYTRIHLNHYWKVVSELSVVVHGVMVAILAGQAWPQFFGGFLGMFIVTQMHGLGLSKAMRWAFGLAYAGSIWVIYSFTEGVAKAYMVTIIPLVEFILVVIVSALLMLFLWLFTLGKSSRPV